MARAYGVALALLIVGPACAQVSGSVTLLSDDRYRGQSLSDGEPTAQLALAWDRGDGWYAGMQLSRVRLTEAGNYANAQLHAIPYIGYVRVMHPGVSAEVGIQYDWFSRSGRYDSPEVYVGLSGERVRTRLAWMPHYFGQAAAWYGEVGGDYPLHGRLRAIGHAGALRVRDADGYSQHASRWREDIAAGLGISLGQFDFQVTWTALHGGSGKDAPCEPWQCGGRDGWVLRLSRSW